MFTDTHCHLYFNSYQNDLDSVLERAWDAGLTRILIPGIDLDTSRQAVALSERHPNLYAAVGIHPNDCSGWDARSIAELRELTQHPRVVAIGEIGLDNYREHTPRDLQRQVLQEQLELAAESNLPVIIHNRNAWEDLWPLLQDWQNKLKENAAALGFRPGVLHSFGENLERAQLAINHHFYLGISGPITFTNAKEKQALVRDLPVESILTETDSPYLTPHPHRGRRNEPAYVAYVTEKIAALQNQPTAAVAAVTFQNAAQLFQWEHFD